MDSPDNFRFFPLWVLVISAVGAGFRYNFRWGGNFGWRKFCCLLFPQMLADVCYELFADLRRFFPDNFRFFPLVVLLISAVGKGFE